MNADDRRRLGLEVASRRTQKGWSKEKAAREAGVSSITWKRVEDGEVVQDASLAVILGAVGLSMHGDVLALDAPPQRDIVDRVADIEQRLAELERRLR